MLSSAHRLFASPAKRAIRLLALLALGLALLPASAPAQAEGSRDMIADNTGGEGFRAHLEFHALASSGGISRQTTIKAYAEPGETIYLGSSAMAVGSGDVIIRGPTDTTPAALWPVDAAARRCTTRAAGSPLYGRIVNRGQEVSGPLPAAAGFTPCVVSAAETTTAGAGIWEFDFISPNPTVRLPLPANPDPIKVNAEWAGRAKDLTGYWINAWDVSVRDTDAGDSSGPVDLEIPGRVFANYLPLNMGANASPTPGSPTANLGLFSKFYIQTFDGYGYLVDMNGLDPFAFIFFGNAEGIVDQAGAPIYRSVQLAGTNSDQRLPTDAAGVPIYRIHNPRNPDDLANNDVTHKIFFDVAAPGFGPNPDLPTEAASPSGRTWLLRPPVAPPVPQNVSFVGEEGTPGQAGTNPLGGFFTFNTTTSTNATYNITIDLNGDGQFGTGNDRTLNGPTDSVNNRVYWDGLDGAGVKVTAGLLTFSAQIQLFVGEVHFPFIDAENHRRGHRLQRVVDANRLGEPDASLVYYNDQYNFRGGATYDWSLCAATDTPEPPAAFDIALPRCYGQPLDARSVLQGTPSINPADPTFPGAHRWTTPTGGPGANGYGDRRLIDTWTYYPSAPIPVSGSLLLAEADLAITKSHSPAQLTPGGPLSYSVVVTNNGPSPVVGARVRDDVPAAVVGVSWSCAVTRGVGSCGTASGSGNLIETTVDLAPNAEITYAISGTVDPSATGSLSNTASVRRPNDTTDPNLGNNTATDIAPILISADLELNKTLLTPPPLAVNSELAFSIALRNRGPGSATNVAVTERLPAGLSFVSATPSKGGYAQASGVWSVGSMARDEVATLTLRARWDGSQVRNTAEVTGSDQPDPDSTPGNGNPNEDDQSSVPIPSASADLELTKRVSAARVNVGQNATFTIDLTNRGPDTATNVRVSDRLPVGLSFVRATPSQGSYDQISGDWTVGTLAKDARASLSVEVTVLGPGPFTNTAQVSASDQFDIDSTPNNDVPGEDDQGFATLGGDLADLSLTKSLDNFTPTINDEITYTVLLKNDGPSTATGVAVTDKLPAGLEYVRHTTSQGSYAEASGLWSVGTVGAGSSATLMVSARVRSFARIINSAEVTGSDQPDTDSTPGNGDPTEDDQSSVPLNPQIADLELTKRASTSRPAIGGTVSFTLELTNKGPAVATGVQVAERLPAGLAYISHTTTPANTSYNPGTGIWDISRIDVGEVMTLVIQVRMGGIGPFTNTAEVSHSDQFDPDSTPGNGDPAEDDQASASVSSPIADLSVSKRAAAIRPSTAGEVTYTIGVHNAGPDAATGVRVGENLPAGSTLLASTPSKGTYGGGNWVVGDLAVGETALLNLTIRVGGPPPYVNSAEVTASDLPDPDSTPGNGDPSEDDFASVALPSGLIDLELAKSVAALPKLPNGALFALDLVNRGPDQATGVEVEDKLPAGLRFVSAAPTQGAYDPVSGRWAVGSLAVNATARLLIAVEIVAAPNATLVNFAQVARANELDVDSTPNNRPLAPPQGQPQVEDDEAAVYFSRLTPVTLTSLKAMRTAAGVQVAWQTGMELDTAGFYVYRAEDGRRATAARITPSLVAPRGGSATGASYSFLDAAAEPGQAYTYWLVEVAGGGATVEYGPVRVASGAYQVWLPSVRR